MSEILAYGNGNCAVCRKKISVGYLMCAYHWAQVPKAEQDAVYAALRRWDASQGTLQDLRDAQNAAIATVVP